MASEPRGKAELIAAHYQDTYAMTRKFWDERNRIFVWLVAVIGVTSLLALELWEADSLFVRILAAILDIEGDDTIKKLASELHFELLYVISSCVVFYLFFLLFRYSHTIGRNYKYLGKLETELRALLDLDAQSHAFTREDKFYRDNEIWLQKNAKWVYALVLLILLILYMYAIYTGCSRSGDTRLIILNAILAAATLTYYVAYVGLSIKWKRKDRKKNKDK